MSTGKQAKPPYEITPAILRNVVEIGELLGALKAHSGWGSKPRLSRVNRIKTIQGTLEIEGNTLSREQVTAVLEGKAVLAPPREIQEVKNAFAAYDKLSELVPHSQKSLFDSHKLMMFGLVDDLGCFRSGNVGVRGAEGVVHVAPPVKQVSGLMKNLLGWLKETDEHPLIASSVFHYEFEVIHPFQDGNGRMGRLWQTLILGIWNSVFNFLPVENMIRDHRENYYDALNACNKAGESTEFIEFALDMINKTVSGAIADSAAGEVVTGQVKSLLKTLRRQPLNTAEIMGKLRIKSRLSFRETYLIPAIQKELVEMTEPDSPRSPTQRYKLTEKGLGKV
ncbi:MAG: Fic family protein [Thermodesulfobacteriota bacterium]